MAGNDFWGVVGKVAVVNWMLDFPQLKKQAPAGWSDGEVSNIVSEANRRIRSLNGQVRSLKSSHAKEVQRLTDEILERDEMIDALEMRIIEMQDGADCGSHPSEKRTIPQYRERSPGRKNGM